MVNVARYDFHILCVVFLGAGRFIHLFSKRNACADKRPSILRRLNEKCKFLAHSVKYLQLIHPSRAVFVVNRGLNRTMHFT